MTEKEYNNQVDESLVLFGGGAPCVNIDPKMWTEFKKLYKHYNDAVPRVVDWSFDSVALWMEEYDKQTV